MTYTLTVVEAFGPYSVGDVVADSAAMETMLADHAHRVVRVAVPDAVKPAPMPEPAFEAEQPMNHEGV